ncbi:MAG TPA: IS200/IS605 family transposase [Bacteroidales bacterium]|nr:IS200/IS605 family transposase [Bacteroidales bacterium]HPL04534.1 IS200/IS605 family transposase [Bacteroidales bacterium]
MSTYTQLLYHIVFSTKNRNHCLIKENREELFRYIWGLLNNKKCHLYRINGVEDHIHIATHIHQTISISSLIKDIKLSSNDFIKSKNLFNKFNGWQEGYGIFTYNIKEKDNLIKYIKNQGEHHKKISYKEELLSLLKEFDIEFDEKYLL